MGLADRHPGSVPAGRRGARDRDRRSRDRTSAEYARGHHVLDPHTRRPPHGIVSVTVTGPDLATADAYATAAFAMGYPRALHWTARLQDYEALLITADDEVLSTPGFPEAAATAAA